MKFVTRPTTNDYAPAFAGYVSLVPEDDILGALEQQSAETQKLLTSLDDVKAAHRYAEGKWSVKEVVGHFIDAERVFAYRALAIARGETQPLPGFDEDEYVRNAGFDAWPVGDLAEHYSLVRKSSIVMYRNLPEEAWARRGNSNGKPILAAALVWITVGHERHHVKILRERYGL